MHTALQMYVFFVKSITLNIEPRSLHLMHRKCCKVSICKPLFPNLTA